MITTLTLAAALASQCVHKPRSPRHGAIIPMQSCVSLNAPYPQWQPRDNEDSLSQDSLLSPVTTGALTKYLTITQTEPCHVYSSVGGTMPQWFPTGAAVRAPEIDPAGWTAGLTILFSSIAVMRGGRNSK